MTTDSTTTTDSARVDPLSAGVARTLIALLVIVAAAAFALSAMGLARFAQVQMGVSAGLSWLLPLAVDAGIVVFGLGVIVNRARGEAALLPWMCLIGATLISAGANALKVLTTTEPTDAALAWAGPAMGAVVPLILLASTEVLIRAVIRPTRAAAPAVDQPEQITVTRADAPAVQAGAPAAIQAADTEAEQPVEQADAPAEPTPIRRTATPAKKPATRKKATRPPSTSLLPEDRVEEAERLIAQSTADGLSTQAAADWVSEQMGLPGAVTKSRVVRWRRAQADTAQAA